MIQTRDGEKAIQDIQIGDWVLSDDPSTPGDIEYKQVVQTFVYETNYLVDVYIGGEKITTTENHPFWVKDVGWVAARDLNAGSQLQTKTESWLDVERVEKHTEVATVYNFEVQGFHTYFVSDLGLLVHNACVDTRINIANDRTRFTPIRPSTGNPVSAGFDHVLNGHSSEDSMMMLLRDQLWEIIVLNVDIQCPRCQQELGLSALFDMELKKVILECTQCGWTQTIDGQYYKPLNRLYIANSIQLIDAGLLINKS